MNWTLVVILAIVNIPSYLILMRLFFGDRDGLFEALRFWATPEILSLLRGEIWEDQSAEWKLALYIASCIILVLAEYALIMRILEW